MIIEKDNIIYKTIPSHPDYGCSENGDIIRFKTGNKLSPFVQKSSHMRIQLNDGKKYLIHRLVYETWHGFEDENHVIDHIDGNPKNNHISNLRECTQKDNIKYSLENNRFGKNHNTPVIIQDIHTNEIFEFESRKALAIFLGYKETYEKGMKCTITKKFKEKYKVLSS